MPAPVHSGDGLGTQPGRVQRRTVSLATRDASAMDIRPAPCWRSLSQPLSDTTYVRVEFVNAGCPPLRSNPTGARGHDTRFQDIRLLDLRRAQPRQAPGAASNVCADRRAQRERIPQICLSTPNLDLGRRHPTLSERRLRQAPLVETRCDHAPKTQKGQLIAGLYCRVQIPKIPQIPPKFSCSAWRRTLTS